MRNYRYLFSSFFIAMLLILACDPDDDSSDETNHTITVDDTKIDRKVLIIGIDGFRSDVMNLTSTPFINDLIQNKNTYSNINHIAEGITYSGPNWSSILTGVHMDKHNVLNNDFDNDNYSEYPSFFHYISSADSSKKTASIVNWIPINTYLMSDYADYAPLNYINDSEVLEHTKNLLLNDNPINTDVIFIHFDELDATGHAHGFSGDVQEYVDKANQLDSYTSELYEIIQNKRLNGEDWLLMVVSDHGGEGTSHGDANNPNINRTIFISEHPSVEFQAGCCYFSSQADIGPTVLNFLGITSTKFDESTDGYSIILN
ncbi:MAG: hypothetical protein CMD27_00040 [Flavobacteriales bacterium]|nr:hypothetical protein [Flavobacteriales bacterium]